MNSALAAIRVNHILSCLTGVSFVAIDCPNNEIVIGHGGKNYLLAYDGVIFPRYASEFKKEGREQNSYSEWILNVLRKKVRKEDGSFEDDRPCEVL
jgi:hypothetical protein